MAGENGTDVHVQIVRQEWVSMARSVGRAIPAMCPKIRRAGMMGEIEPAGPRMIPTVVFAVAVVALVITAEVILAKRRKAKFKERFPPISDAEFMALCPPGTNSKIALKVRRILSDQLGVEYERIYPSSRIVDDLGAD
jgi:hypothetical protein